MEGIRGSNVESDVAIDDISIHNSSCAGEVLVTFDVVSRNENSNYNVTRNEELKTRFLQKVFRPWNLKVGFLLHLWKSSLRTQVSATETVFSGRLA